MIDRLVFTKDTGEQFEAFQAYERERILNPRGQRRPAGLRLSIDCPVRRVKAYFDPWYELPVDLGDADRGHELENRFRALAMHDIEHVAQQTIEWSRGFSAWDFVRFDEFEDGKPIEVKSSIPYSTLQSPWPRQIHRMAEADEQPVGSDVDVYLLHAGNYRVRDIGPVTFTAEDQERVAAERERVTAAFDYLAVLEDAASGTEFTTQEWWVEQGLVCTCGGCHHVAELDATGVLERWGMRYERAQRQADAAKAELETLRPAMLLGAYWQLAGGKGKVRTWGGLELDGYDINVTPLAEPGTDGAPFKGMVRRRAAKPVEAAA